MYVRILYMLLLWKIVKPNECKQACRNIQWWLVWLDSERYEYFTYFFKKNVKLIDLMEKLVEIFNAVGGLEWEVGNDFSANSRTINLTYNIVSNLNNSDGWVIIITYLDLIINLRQRLLHTSWRWAILWLDARRRTRRYFYTILRWCSIYCTLGIGRIWPTRCYSMRTAADMSTAKSVSHCLHFKQRWGTRRQSRYSW